MIYEDEDTATDSLLDGDFSCETTECGEEDFDVL